MNVNVFIREIVVHDTRDPGNDPGEYDVAFAAAIDADPASVKTSPRWTNQVRKAESYEILEWLGPFSVQDGVRLTVCARGREHDLIGSDQLLGGVAHLTGDEQWGVGRWLRTTNGKHFDFLFAVTRAEEGHAGRPTLTGRHGEVADAPGPREVTSADYPAGLD
jgi:hypothetical protein